MTHLLCITSFVLAAICLAVGTWPRKPRVEPPRYSDDRRTPKQLGDGAAIEQAFADIRLEREYDHRVKLNRAARRELRAQLAVLPYAKVINMRRAAVKRQAG